MSGAVESASFDARYAAEPDPWGYETSAYEIGKYARTLASLPPGKCGSALEVGCSNGALTARLAPRCQRLVAIDFSAEAVSLARRRVAGRGGVEVEQRDARDGLPAGPWDLVLCSEVLYYMAAADVEDLRDAIPSALAPGGSFLAVHWRGNDPDAPLDGGEVHRLLRRTLDRELRRVDSEREAGYLLDRWVHPGPA